MHADRLLDVGLTIDGVVTGKYLEYLAVGRNLNRSSGFFGPTQVFFRDLLIRAAYCNHSLGVKARDMGPVDTDGCPVNANARNALGFIYGRSYGANRLFDIDHHSLAHATGGC